ncbi:hypothetical protein D3C75_742110 [compost metagenome]
MIRIIQAGHGFVHPVHRQGILDQIIGADAEELDLFRQQIRHHHRCRHFDHNAHRRVVLKRLVLLDQLFFGLLQNFVSLPHLIHRRDHGIHDPDIAVQGCPENRLQLGFEQLPAIQQNADGPVAQRRIILLGQVHEVHAFIPADVQGADHQRPVTKLHGGFPVNLVLLILQGQ